MGTRLQEIRIRYEEYVANAADDWLGNKRFFVYAHEDIGYLLNLAEGSAKAVEKNLELPVSKAKKKR